MWIIFFFSICLHNIFKRALKSLLLSNISFNMVCRHKSGPVYNMSSLNFSSEGLS